MNVEDGEEQELTKWMMPAAVSQTEMKMEMSWASLKVEETKK